MGSVGPAGFTKSGLPAGGFIFTLSMVPKGPGGMVPGLMNQRRLKTCSGASAVAKPSCAGRLVAHVVMDAQQVDDHQRELRLAVVEHKTPCVQLVVDVVFR